MASSTCLGIEIFFGWRGVDRKGKGKIQRMQNFSENRII